MPPYASRTPWLPTIHVGFLVYFLFDLIVERGQVSDVRFDRVFSSLLRYGEGNVEGLRDEDFGRAIKCRISSQVYDVRIWLRVRSGIGKALCDSGCGKNDQYGVWDLGRLRTWHSKIRLLIVDEILLFL
jgi:hypothetical protein